LKNKFKDGIESEKTFGKRKAGGKRDGNEAEDRA
jgi:hypothetical protein